MADRYWVGGSGTWDATSTANWSVSSGGAGGASVPTAADNVLFDTNSGGITLYTVTIVGAALPCLDITVTGTNTRIGGGSTNINVSGSMSLVAGSQWTNFGTVTFVSTTAGRTITTNGVSMGGNISFDGAGSWTLNGAISMAGVVVLRQGTFNTGGFALTTAGITSSVTTTRAINLGSSTVTLTSGVPIDISSATGLTFNAGTSQINCISSGPVITSPGLTFYNVAFTALSTTLSSIGITGQNTFNNLSFVPCTSVGYRPVNISANQTINGVLSTSGTHGGNRVWLRSSTEGMQWNLTINGTPSLTDVDFRDLRIVGTAAPISGTRIGNIGGCSGITFSTPKTVYWVRPFGGNWGGFGDWALSSGGSVSFNNQPLPQDIAIIDNNSMNTGVSIALDGNFTPAHPTIDISGRTTAMTLATGSAIAIMMGDLKLSTSVTMSDTNTLSFKGRNTQTITSAGRTFTQPITIDSVGGIVQLADALNIGTLNALTITNGTFDTKNFNVTAGTLSSSNSNVRTINLGSSTVTLSATSATVFTNSTNSTLNAGTSTINCSSINPTFGGGNLTFYDVNFTSTQTGSAFINGTNIFRNVSVAGPVTGSVSTLTISANQTITGTLTCNGSTSILRLFLRSNTLGTIRTLTVNSLSATNCDFRDITIAGAAAGSSQTRAGDCGGNSGITFPAAKTVYWNLAGTQDWNAIGWAPVSGGTPDINNFPLAQDTAVFDNTGAITTITINALWNIGAIDMSSRTTAMTFGLSVSFTIYSNLKMGTGVTTSGTSSATFSGRGTQTITSNGRVFNGTIAIDSITGTVQLADALAVAGNILLSSGTFNAVAYNVLCGTTFQISGTVARTLNMGTGIWTLSGISTVWSITSLTNLTYFSGTATIVLSTTSASPRSWSGGGLYYNKLTIGGATGTSTTTFSSADTFGELASIKSVAHTVALTGGPSIGLWSITGTVGNVVTVTGTINLSGQRVSGVNYLALGTTTVTATNPVEFYAGVNSTGTGINTAAPATVIRYWRGGTGTWDATSTTNWSVSSGGAGGASVPTSADTVIFNTASNATAYTVTLTATQLRCASLLVGGSASGNITFAGTAPLSVTESFTMNSTGVTRTYTGNLTFGGTGSGKTISAGQTLNSAVTLRGINAVWSLSSAWTSTGEFTFTNGTFNTANFAFSPRSLLKPTLFNKVTLNLGSSAINLTGSSGINFGNSTATNFNSGLTFNANTSTITLSGGGVAFYHSGVTFYDVIFSNAGNFTVPFNQGSRTVTFNNLTLALNTLATGYKPTPLSTDIVVNGTLAFTGTPTAITRTSLTSSILGVPRAITAAVVTGMTDVDFQDIICNGAATWTGTRIGDLGGNTNVPVSTPKTVYWKLATSGNWSATAWALSSGGTPAIANFPLPQDTAIIDNSSLNTSATITFDVGWSIGTIDMSGRTTAMTLNPNGSTLTTVYGDWTFGTGVTTSSFGTMTFSKRGTQTITSNGRSFTQGLVVNSLTGTLQLADALQCTGLTVTSGALNAVSYNVTSTTFTTTGTSTKTVSLGSGLWTCTQTGTSWALSTITGLTFNKGSANIILTASGAVATFDGGGLSYNKLTIGGGTNTQSFTITGNNTFNEIASTRTVAYTIQLTSSTQRVGAFTVSGSAGNLVTIIGTSIANFATLIYTGASTISLNYIIPTFLKVYNVTDTWYAGTNSINGGSYGWIFAAAPVGPYSAGGSFFVFF